MAGWNADTLARSPGAGAATIVEGSAFCVSAASGDIVPDLPHGVFFRDTRVVSRMTLLIDGVPVEPLSTMLPEPYRMVVVGRAGHVTGRADTPLVVERDRRIGDTMQEELTLRSYSRDPIRCRVELVVEADFADIFEVKEGRALGILIRAAASGRSEVRVEPPGRVDRLGVVVTAPGAVGEPDRLRFDVVIPARGSWRTKIEVTPTIEGKPLVAPALVGEHAPGESLERRFLAWQSDAPVTDLDDDVIEQTIVRSHRDLGSLRIFDPEHPERAVVAAGAPWFMTLFGRDSLLTSYMALPLDPTLALGTLQTLADLQGTRFDAACEEQEGRILHEVRLGANTNLALGGGSVYYGTADATPLFVVVLGELDAWGGLPDDASEPLLTAADRALAWVERDGDRDGDGFVEYERLNDHGLVNQGWKDSWDGITFADGTLAEAPIALAEVQGYVYAAYRARAALAAHRGDEETAARCDERARALKQAFNERFWLPDRGYFALALDRDKRPVDSCASNMGHCLWSGIVDEDKAALVADRLLSPEMFNGWGVRTLATDMGAYNPASYHNGSVWPHDNAIVAAGLMRYGFSEHAGRIVVGILDAAARFDGRLPELFCGFDRAEYSDPVVYPASCSPQAWASATPFSLLRTVLRFDPAVPDGEVWLAPALPPEFGSIHLRHVPFAGTRISMDVTDKGADVSDLPAGIQLHDEPRPLALRARRKEPK